MDKSFRPRIRRQPQPDKGREPCTNLRGHSVWPRSTDEREKTGRGNGRPRNDFLLVAAQAFPRILPLLATPFRHFDPAQRSNAIQKSSTFQANYTSTQGSFFFVRQKERTPPNEPPRPPRPATVHGRTDRRTVILSDILIQHNGAT